MDKMVETLLHGLTTIKIPGGGEMSTDNPLIEKGVVVVGLCAVILIGGAALLRSAAELKNAGRKSEKK